MQRMICPNVAEELFNSMHKEVLNSKKDIMFSVQQDSIPLPVKFIAQKVISPAFTAKCNSLK